MPRRMTERERQEFLAEPHIGVLSVAAGDDRPPHTTPVKYVTVECSVVGSDSPPSAEQMLAIVGRYLPEEAAQGFVEEELGHPGLGPVLFTVRPDRWLTFDFA
jgi:hypothetical protein